VIGISISKKSVLRNRYLTVGIILLLSIGFAGCQKKEVKKIILSTPTVVVQKDVFKQLPDEEANILINKVREYAEAFDIGAVDKDIKVLLKSAIAKGSKADDILDEAREVVNPFMEAQLKEKIAEGLDKIAGRHTEKDVLQVYEAMDQESLVDFIIQYEIERLKMEGYLR
jgi:hypothetical protein